MVTASIFGVLIPLLLVKSLFRILMGRIGRRMLELWLILVKMRAVQIPVRLAQLESAIVSVRMSGLCRQEAPDLAP